MYPSDRLKAILVVVTALFLTFLIIVFYFKQEKESMYPVQATCELAVMGKLLNEEFVKFAQYPDELKIEANYNGDLIGLGCGRVPLFKGGKILDPWGDPYCYEKTNKETAFLYSVNSQNFDAKIQNAIPRLKYFRLYLGEMEIDRIPFRIGIGCDQLQR